MIDGVFVANKPAGITSHDVVDRARKIFRQRRIGHAGTLDPIATGILILLLGKATRLSRFLMEGEKRYEGVVRLGWATDTDDTEGEPLSDPRPVEFTEKALQTAAAELVGPQDQLPPLYSAKKKGGEPAYARARKDQPVERDTVPVEIFSMEVQRVDEDHLRFDCRCTSGTYARSIARDLGEKLGCGGHLEELIRTRSGPFTLEHAHRLSELEDRQAALDRVVPFDEIPLPFPDVTISLEEAEKVGHGMAVPSAGRVSPEQGRTPEWIRLRDPQGNFLALAGVDGPWLQPRVVFNA